MDFSIDRKSPLPVHQQLKGMFEYAIACGELSPGEALPSVRELAAQIGVAPMTISQVYRELKKQELVSTRPGSGTQVAENLYGRFPARSEVLALHRRIDALIDSASAIGIRAGDLASMINARLVFRSSLGRHVSIVMVGLFPEATASYARIISHHIGGGAAVEPLTVDEIERDPALRARAASADLAITLMSQHQVVAALLDNTKTVAIRFIPSEETRRSLASIDPMARVVLVSRFAEFLPMMRNGVRRFASHVADVDGGSLNDEGIRESAKSADVVVFSTGAEAIRDYLNIGTVVFEYRHTPDPSDIERIVLPALRAATLSSNEETREAS